MWSKAIPTGTWFFMAGNFAYLWLKWVSRMFLAFILAAISSACPNVLSTRILEKVLYRSTMNSRMPQPSNIPPWILAQIENSRWETNTSFVTNSYTRVTFTKIYEIGNLEGNQWGYFTAFLTSHSLLCVPHRLPFLIIFRKCSTQDILIPATPFFLIFWEFSNPLSIRDQRENMQFIQLSTCYYMWWSRACYCAPSWNNTQD